MLSRRIKTSICNYFNKDGYVLDFSNATFDEFTEDVVGIPIQEWASEKRGCGLSKGRSFEYFINTQSDELIYNLVFELVEHLKGFEYADHNPCKDYDLEKAEKLLKEVEDNYNPNLLSKSAEDLKIQYNNDYIVKKIDEMSKLKTSDSREAIGKSKELLESTFKYVLEDANIKYTNKDDLMDLRKKSFKYLNLDTKSNEAAKDSKNVKQILSGLTQIVQGMGNLRNGYGSGHGISPTGIILPERYGELSVNAAITISKFVVDTLNDMKSSKWGVNG